MVSGSIMIFIMDKDITVSNFIRRLIVARYNFDAEPGKLEDNNFYIKHRERLKLNKPHFTLYKRICSGDQTFGDLEVARKKNCKSQADRKFFFPAYNPIK